MTDDLRGIFRFKTVYELQVNSIWTPPQYGYFGGGPATSNIDRIDYSNDTVAASVKGSLSITRNRSAATGNSSYGWFGGGYTGGTGYSTVDRIDYSNDTAVASVRGSLSIYSFGVSRLAAAGNSDFGWFGGGYLPPPSASPSQAVTRINYANDTAVSLARGPLPSGVFDLAASGNSSYGWFGGGYLFPNFLTTVNRVDYSNDIATASPRGPLSIARSRLAATGNSSYGWFGAGQSPGSPGLIATVDRIDYSNDTATSSPRGPLSRVNNFLSATGNSSFGYFGGGGVPASISTVDRIDYSNDTAIASTRGPLSSNRAASAATSATANGLSQPATISGPVYAFGYFGGGAPNSGVVDRIDYSNDTATALARGPGIVGRFRLAATGNSSYGYFGGGYVIPGGGSYSRVDRIDYANDTGSVSARGNLAVGNKDRLAATGNSSYGWFGGGYILAVGSISSVDRIDYANDTPTASPRGKLSISKICLTATGNNAYGWFGGGSQGTALSTTQSTVDRVDYSNDTATASPRGVLTAARRYLSATGNNFYGYFGGGYTNVPSVISTVDRIDYSNDTATASPKGPLNAAKGYYAATGSTSYGYFGGGGPGTTSLVSRIDYSNDTATASPKGPLSLARVKLASTSAQANAVTNTTGPSPSLPYPFTSNLNLLSISARNSSRPLKANTPVQTRPYGYFGGGSGPVVSTIDRIDYSNDTATASPRGSLTIAISKNAGTGNSSYGYFGGGDTPSSSPGILSTVNRVDYSNDTSVTSVRGPLNGARTESSAATGNSSYGWFGGGGFVGDSPSIISTKVDRIDYSNDTTTASPKGSLSTASRRLIAATGNQSFGYFGGGVDTGTTTYTIISRINYSNDTATSLSRGGLNNSQAGSSATGNSSYGWFGGGVFSTGGPGLDGFRSRVERIDYSNDTVIPSIRGPLTTNRYYAAATGNSSFGYFGGGRNSPSVTYSSVDRVDYSNDTATASPKGILSTAKDQFSATSPYANALPQ